ncbi:hypothetical protein [Pseudoalteromonas arctica]|uniref:Uncharacterized protein n=1 Tax=Pseudoalteromonas arctica TaxID=394751 RepID=A0A7Y0H9P0_9GAMM|nr:hypothetical protein [Pseudoalteromonas arctica]NMM39665.1 hypothetical protein [Pseudoalteromonas arctica]
MSSDKNILNLTNSEMTVLISALALAESRYISDIQLFEANLDLSSIPQPEFTKALISYKERLSICESLSQKLINLPMTLKASK